MTTQQITIKETIMATVLTIIIGIEIGVGVLIGLDHVPQFFHPIEIIVLIALILLEQIVVVLVTDLVVLIGILVINQILPGIDPQTLHTVEAIAWTDLTMCLNRKTKYPCSRPALGQEGHSNADYTLDKFD
jgi:hypothetical protein